MVENRKLVSASAHKEKTMGFPSTFPPDCPLQTATDCNGEVYMVFKETSISAEHCYSQAERGRATTATGDGTCTRHGLSVFPTLKGCQHQRDLMPFLGQHIGVASLSIEHGKLAPTPSGKNPEHMTWWSYEGIERHALFSIVEEV